MQVAPDFLLGAGSLVGFSRLGSPSRPRTTEDKLAGDPPSVGGQQGATVMAEEQTPKPGAGDGARSGTDQKPAGGTPRGTSDTKAPPAPRK